jgi:hypothetical protein
MFSLQTGLFTFLLLIMIRENNAQSFSGHIEMIPSVMEQVIEVGSELTLTCVTDRWHGISWQLPDYVVKYPEVS